MAKKASKRELLDVIVNTLNDSGYNIDYVTDIDKHPFVLNVFNQNENFIVRIFIWNISPGGNRRPKDEYRIQITGVKQFERLSNEKTLILGWWEELKVFVGYDYNYHNRRLGSSPSFQIKESKLNEAFTKGISKYVKDNGEIAIAFKSEYLADYIKNIEEWHTVSQLTLTQNEIEFEAEDEYIPFRYSITSYGADYPVDTIVKRIEEEVIFVPPFQRKFVWRIDEASRFIESLILGLPVPGIFLAKESDTGRLLIIDGQQRLFTLYNFTKGVFKAREFKLTGVQEDLKNKTYAELNTEDRLRFNDSIIHATVVRQDEPNDDGSSVYLLFERLNTTGKKLTPQEIRACIYYGEFNNVLNELASNEFFTNIFGMSDDRLKGPELILRFFALYYNFKNYAKPLKGFLNSFMFNNRNLQLHSKENLEKIFKPCIEFINLTLGSKTFRRTGGINAAIFDSVMIGVAKRLAKGQIKNHSRFVDLYNKLILNKDYVYRTEVGTSDDIAVKKRIDLAIKQFENLP